MANTVPPSQLTVFNSLGYAYMEAGDLADARASLVAGLRYQDDLPPVSRAKLFSNLGYVQALLGNNAEAVKYLRMAAALGNTVATTNLARLTKAN
jgi:Flp pilus assembly protein TadD